MSESLHDAISLQMPSVLLDRGLLIVMVETWQARIAALVWNVILRVLVDSLLVVEHEADHGASVCCVVWGAAMEGTNVSDEQVATMRREP